MNKFELSITSELANIHVVEIFLEKLFAECELTEKFRGNLTLSVIEAVNNAILSGNKNNPEKIVKLTAVKENKYIMVSIEDEGEGFDYEKIPNPTLPENIMKGTGRGLYLMKTLSDELLFEKNGAKAVLSFDLIKQQF